MSGLTKSAGYSKKKTLSPEQMTQLQKILQGAGENVDQSAEGYRQFLPGGGGGEAIKAQAMQDFQRKTLPAITGQFGSDSKSSSALNQALAQGGADLNTSLASFLSQMQLNAAQGLGDLGTRRSQIEPLFLSFWLKHTCLCVYAKGDVSFISNNSSCRGGGCGRCNGRNWRSVGWSVK